MTLITIVTDSGLQTSINVSRVDLIAEVKALIVREFPFYQGLMLNLTLHGKELSDEKALVSVSLLVSLKQ